jgi:prepilin-type N-terminal cleavage/methylation domain-containing protein
VKAKRGITLLEMIVATTILAIAVVGMMAGMSGTTRNAARLQDYDRAVQLGRTKMNDLLLDNRIARNALVSGEFDRSQSGGMEAGWKARVSDFEQPPVHMVGETAIDRVELEVWWRSGSGIRTYTLDAYRPRPLTPDDMGGGGAP